MVCFSLKNYFKRALHYAAGLKDQPKMVEVLVSNGALIDAVNEERKTPLFVAVQSNNPAAVASLLRHNANYKLKNSDGHNAFDLIKDASEWTNSDYFNEAEKQVLQSKGNLTWLILINLF